VIRNNSANPVAAFVKKGEELDFLVIILQAMKNIDFFVLRGQVRDFST